ncbi:prohibitin-1 [Jimgerdemannia flammicorona]|uniref:Prohibitin n=1 Tax=Jimgerdemannia flammicorona TaxID=994334 RepID=A0A433QZ94_9FUNG|nr:prohibitin-1 [Jimgerdemannia flammicorona]
MFLDSGERILKRRMNSSSLLEALTFWSLGCDLRRARNISTTTGSKDMQMVSAPEISRLSSIYQNLGMDYDERVLPSVGNEMLMSIVAQFDAGELIIQRAVVSRIREDLVKREMEFNIQLDNMSIVCCLPLALFCTFAFVSITQDRLWTRNNLLILVIILFRLLCLLAKTSRTLSNRNRLRKQEADGAKFIVEKAPEKAVIEASKNIVSTLAQAKNVTYLSSSGGKNGDSIILLNVSA